MNDAVTPTTPMGSTLGALSAKGISLEPSVDGAERKSPMSKFNQKQTLLIIKRLRKQAGEFLNGYREALKDTIVPPRVPVQAYSRRLNKMVYDQPQEAVKLLQSLLCKPGFTPDFVNRYNQRRHKAFDVLETSYAEVEGLIMSYLEQMEVALWFENDWNTDEYPQFLHDELDDYLKEFTDDDTR